MAPLSAHSAASAAWALAAKQHGVIALFQLVALGYTLEAVRWRVAKGRLHPVYRGVYAVGRPNLTRKGEWMAAVLACAPTAALSHETGAALWGLRQETPRGDIHISVPAGLSHHHRGIAVHRRSALTWPRSRRGDARIEQTDITLRDGIPVTAPILTLIDLAARLPERRLEAAINEADRLDLVTPMELREELEARRGQRGVGAIKAVFDRGGFVLTESDLERRFLPVAARAGLPTPQTQQVVNGFRVDFFWPELGLVVETDGLRYHRTAEQQARDRLRDQAHTAAGLTQLRFTHWQVRYDPGHVERTLRAVTRLRAA